MNSFLMARPIPSCNSLYAASEDGAIYSLVSGTPVRMTPSVFGDGYLRVKVKCSDGIRRMCAVHRLVAEVFHENQGGKPLVNHKNGVKSDCAAANLEWSTHKENMEHAVSTGLHRPARSLDMALVKRARELRYAGLGFAAIGAAIGRSASTAHRYAQEYDPADPLGLGCE